MIPLFFMGLILLLLGLIIGGLTTVVYPEKIEGNILIMIEASLIMSVFGLIVMLAAVMPDVMAFIEWGSHSCSCPGGGYRSCP